jgi:hypothetical protein
MNRPIDPREHDAPYEELEPLLNERMPKFSEITPSEVLGSRGYKIYLLVLLNIGA